ncbi:response regulator [Novosphingobium terrae]|uniref:response regulator n=1 Tax=Novosphingobium terrae TaxID=2726189 RepID=UPI00197FA931|nr:response regulator [Novosphingobium terrae]
MGPRIDRGTMVLVVEDEPMIRMNGVDLLEDQGYQVLEAASADEAITLLEQAPDVRLLFSDIDMPGSMNGVELAELVHRRWPGIRLLLTSGQRQVSGEDMPEDGRFLAKPYSQGDVIDQVKDLLSR